MDFATDPSWLASLIYADEVRRAGNPATFYRAVGRGEHHRLTTGVFVPQQIWAEASYDERHLMQVIARGRRSPSAVHSHLTAASLWRLPLVGSWPVRSHAVGQVHQTRRAFTFHADPVPSDPDRIDGLTVTSLPRTLVDVARTAALSTSVAMLDRALSERKSGERGVRAARTTMTRLLDASAVRGPSGRRKCSAALELADGASDSPGESLSRVAMHVLGLSRPQLQVEFRDDQGRMVVDFWWPEFGVIGEFDGFGKYLREELRPGQTVAEVVIAEKRREDRLRALGPRVTRWGFAEARSLPALAAILRRAGIR